MSRGPEGVVLVPFTLAGETITADVGPLEKGVRRGHLAAVETPSPDRVAPECPYFGRCGGCHYQHAAYPSQLDIKRAILAETLQRFGKITPSEPVDIIAGEPWRYRNRIQLHFQDGRMGFRAARSHRLIEIDHCPISSPRLNECIAKLSAMTRQSRWPKFLKMLELFTNEEAVQLNVIETGQPVARRFFDWCAAELPSFEMGPLNYAAASGVFRVTKGSFFQVNRFLIDRLVEEVVAGESGQTALDLYAGVGLFSLPLSSRFEQVIAVESGSGAVHDLEVNAPAVKAVRSSVDPFLETYQGPCDLVVADPPRTGLGKLAIKRLLALSPQRIVIVACDPATLARDLTPLLAGGYAIEKLVLIDLFPQTYHLETVAKLKKI